MRPFGYSSPTSVADAITQERRQPDTKFLAGGTNLVDLMKMGVEHPAHLVDVTRLPLAQIQDHGNTLRIGAMARNGDVAAHPIVIQRFPVLSQAILAGASPQIRNMASTGGNLLQRTRCPYFYDPSYAECNKRVPGSGCAAIQGYNRMHAILGSSEQCIATHPGDMPVALMALDARVIVTGGHGERTIPMDSFYRLPGNTPHLEHDLKPEELIIAVEIPAGTWSGSHYLKVRDRNSYAFALVSVAALVELTPDGVIRQARIALGGVAPRPWRVPEAEAALRNRPPDEASFRDAAEIVVKGAVPRRYNAFKVELARRSIVRALRTASQRG
jgi:xanthine dehydrogenase YagS FAD-binding subunit